MKKKIIIIDDDKIILEEYIQLLSQPVQAADSSSVALEAALYGKTEKKATDQYSIKVACQGKDGLEMIHNAKDNGRPYALAFIDVRMPPGWDGIKTARKIREIDSEIEIVLVTAYSDRSREEIIATIGMPAKLLILKKPFDPDEIKQLALSLTSKWELEQSLKQVNQKLEKQIEERKQAQAALAAKTLLFNNIFRSVTDTAIATVDLDFRINSYNPMAEKIFGYSAEEVFGKTVHEMHVKNNVAPERFENAIEHVRQYGEYRYCLEQETGNGIRHIESCVSGIFNPEGELVGYSLFSRDVSKRKQAEGKLKHKETQLLRSQKMESVGTLAGGIAHEFNNLLYIISGMSEILMQDALPESMDYFNEIVKATQRGATLVKQLMAFSRKAETNLYTVDLSVEIRIIKKLLDRILPPMVKVELELAEPLLPMQADQGQIEQVIMNLCLNAKDAMPDGGSIYIKTENSIIDDAFINQHPDIPKGLDKGSCVILSVADTGCGMDKKIKEHIFDPFFTTKAVGQGTGLGLSVLYGIIEGHSGHISCESTLGKGTTFRIYFPAQEADKAQTVPDKEIDMKLQHGSETILIVDDEAGVVAYIEALLNRYEYSTMSANNGESALEIYKARHKEIDLVLLDLGMPGMGGKKCLEKLVEFDINVKVVVISGYSEEGFIRESASAGAIDYAVKPIKGSKILKLIRGALDKST